MTYSFFKRGTLWGLLAVLLVLVGCGYKPSSQYMRNVFDNDVFVDVTVSHDEPENAVYIKDALHNMVINRFGGRVVPKAQAKTIITASYDGTYFSPISYDSNGYITRYRAVVRMKFDIKSSKGKFHRKIATVVEENIGASSTLSSSLRIEAIRVGMARALDQFLAYAAAKGALKEKESE